jgi:hypothetical protein
MPWDPYSSSYYADPNGLPGYDAWKTRSPYDDYDEPEECRHDEHDINWEGRAECAHCHETWWPSPEEVKAHDRLVRRAERGWRRYNSWYMRAWRWWKDRRQRTVPDDDIPF